MLKLLSSHYSPYLLLENSGSVARDHLASERTFLAYVRTSLAIASAGVALVQLFSVSSSSRSSDRIKENLLRFARPLGATIVMIGIIVLLIGLFRYFRIQAALISGKFPPARLTIVFMSSAIVCLVIIVFSILVQAAR
ncbi:uncharacterized protein FOMMEDRAFT_97914 [Fomitiporia mediterranea MF3/22]|uniref:uncharacterized protein n=1 Tax=Fomitiporia mediterranea (strain MF3/22) TaxID=694068 RepID=UPI0004407F3B|nr:uncharacterized protein FOMMEDRAFT_97914 [Fomitiporia mediterranea MF3/22]EJC98023.1 hypothetical protein FOMMEDRAFT_97914 [Fomitiporia mediterranea MF3/22]